MQKYKDMVMMKKKAVIIGAGEFQIQLIEKAKELGYETHVFAWEEGAVGKESADFFYPISITEKEKILKECEKIQPACVVSIGSDLAVLTVNYLNRKLGLASNPESVDRIATNKFAMRKSFSEYGVDVPAFVEVTEEYQEQISEIRKMKFPLIVKPTDRSGSRGICKIECEEELKAAVGKAVLESFEKRAIIEEYIEGNEYSCEAISFSGNHYVLAFTKKYTTGAPDFIETGHMQPSDIPTEIQDYVVKQIKCGLDALEIKTGASHTEFKLTNDGKIRIIEIGARMGGDCIGSDLVYLSTGYDFLKMTLEAAEGISPHYEGIKNKNAAFIKFIFEEADVENLMKIKNQYPKHLYKIFHQEGVGTRIIKDSSERFGYYIVVGKDKDEVERILKDTQILV